MCRRPLAMAVGLARQKSVADLNPFDGHLAPGTHLLHDDDSAVIVPAPMWSAVNGARPGVAIPVPPSRRRSRVTVGVAMLPGGTVTVLPRGADVPTFAVVMAAILHRLSHHSVRCRDCDVDLSCLSS